MATEHHDHDHQHDDESGGSSSFLPAKSQQSTWYERLYFPEIIKGLATTAKHLLFTPDETVQYPEEKLPVRPGYRGEHRLKKDELGRPKCVACHLCATACPSHCIHIVAQEAPWDDRDRVPKLFEIDMMRCIYCGLCEEACPCDAIELTALYNQCRTEREDWVHDMRKLLEV